MANGFSSDFKAPTIDPGVTDLGLGSGFGLPGAGAAPTPRGRGAGEIIRGIALGGAGRLDILANEQARGDKALQDQIKALNQRIAANVKELTAFAKTTALKLEQQGDFEKVGPAVDTLFKTVEQFGRQRPDAFPIEATRAIFEGIKSNAATKATAGKVAIREGAAKGGSKVAEAAVTGVPLTDQDLVILEGPQGRRVSARKGDKRVDQLLRQGFNVVKTPAAQVNILGENALQKRFGKIVGDRIDTIITTGQAAAVSQQSLTQLADFMSAGTPTGTLQPGLTAIQALAEDFGFDVQSFVKSRFGTDIGNVSDKQSFDRIATETIIQGFEKFKGNLNQKEVELAQGAFAGLGTTEQANIDAIAALQASAEVARERAREATAAAVSGSPQAAQRAIDAQLSSESTVRFRELKGRFAQEIRDNISASRELRREKPVFSSLTDVENASIEQIRQFSQTATGDSILALPVDVREALLVRMGARQPEVFEGR